MKYVIDISESDKKIIARIKDNSFIPTPSVDAILNAVRFSTSFPKGHWIYDKSIANWICSKCGETPKTIGYVGTGAFMAEHFKYCNHCGAEMEGAEECKD